MIKVSNKVGSILTSATPCLVVAISNKKEQTKSTEAVNQASGGLITRLKRSKDISATLGSTRLLYNVPGIKAKRLLCVGVGKHEALNIQNLEKINQNILKEVHKSGASSMLYTLDEISNNELKPNKIVEFAILHLNRFAYQFKIYKSNKENPRNSLKQINFISPTKHKDKETRKKSIQQAKAIAQGEAFARDLGNQPGNICTPNFLASEAKKLSQQYSNVSSSVMDEKTLLKLGMNAFYSVSKGSSEPGKLITLQYSGTKKSCQPYVLVGKGITFDTGGISLKPSANMGDMKYDMCGAACVLGVIKAVAEMALNINLVVLVAAAENMPAANASKPGDIVRSFSGKTIEILNTDAEGRLVLCDTLSYAERFKPKSIIDVATLTGACIVALGHHASALYSNEETLSQALIKAGQETGDRAWPMPLWQAYHQQLNSSVADIANIGSPGAGSITAACFLEKFMEKQHWAHLDVAGTAFQMGSKKGASGRPVPLLCQYLIAQDN